MDKNVENNMDKMTVEQKETYYVTKIARLSSEEYKLMTGGFISLLTCIWELTEIKPMIPDWPFSPMIVIPAAISAYCYFAFILNQIVQKKAYHELEELNKTKVKSR